ncbi:MAG: NAD(P)-dependent oxidoreductase [Gemmatimonadota bacterium]
MTGASGFVGGAVACMLHGQGYDVLPFGRRNVDAAHPWLAEYAQWDLTRDVRALDVDAVVHCAALVRQCAPRRAFWKSNVHGTANVLAGTPAGARVVYISTASVYARSHANTPIGEAAAFGASSKYGASKRAGELLAQAHNRSTVILRPHIVYGPGDTTLWPRVVAARRDGVLTVPGTGRNAVSVTHLDNLLAAVASALAPETPGGVYNVADAESPTIDEMLRTMFSRHSLPTRLRYVPKWVAWPVAALLEAAWRATGQDDDPPLTRFSVAGLADPCVLDISRARNVLGYAPTVGFRDGAL